MIPGAIRHQAVAGGEEKPRTSLAYSSQLGYSRHKADGGLTVYDLTEQSAGLLHGADGKLPSVVTDPPIAEDSWPTVGTPRSRFFELSADTHETPGSGVPLFQRAMNGATGYHFVTGTSLASPSHHRAPAVTEGPDNLLMAPHSGPILTRSGFEVDNARLTPFSTHDALAHGERVTRPSAFVGPLARLENA